MNIYQELKVEPVINAMGTVTIYGGSLMPPEVLEAMAQAGRAYVDIRKLHEAAGRKIAGWLGVEAAHVCACASAGITLMAAACMAGSDPARMARLPDSNGMKNRFLVQRSQRNSFDHGITIAGGQLVEVEADLDALRAALADDALAAIYYTHAWFFSEPVLPLAEVAALAHERGLPVLLDAAAEVPPVANLTRFLREGADLVVFSGGKAIRGPQASGMILGRADLVAACAANDSPNTSGLARGMKAGKEEIAGLVKALELYLTSDHAAQMAAWERDAQAIAQALTGLPGVRAERQLPPGVGQLIPHTQVCWDEAALGFSHAQFAETLLQDIPPVAVRVVGSGAAGLNYPRIWVCVNTLEEGQAEIVAQRMRSALEKNLR